MRIPNTFLPEKSMEGEVKKLMADPYTAQKVLKYKKFKVIRENSYDACIERLRGMNFRPLMLYENILARVADNIANGEKTTTFAPSLDSITAIAYKANSTRFKLIPKSRLLENLIYEPNIRQASPIIRYDFIDGTEFDREEADYGRPLQRRDVPNHEFWRAVMCNDLEMLKYYTHLFFTKAKTSAGMGIYLKKTPIMRDMLLPLSIFSATMSLSSISSTANLDEGACFIAKME